MQEKVMYLTDDRDLPEDRQRSLVIFQGGNGDWYVQVAPKNGMTTEGVRICTSGGASANCPGLGSAIADAYRAIESAQRGEKYDRSKSRTVMEEEIRAWRNAFPNHEFVCGQIYEKDET